MSSDGTTTTGTGGHGYGVNVCCPHESTGLCRNCREPSPVTVAVNRMLASENARLRERVAALEAAGNAMVDELVYLSEWGGPGSDYVVYSCHACGVEATSLDAIQHDADCNVKAWLAALAQAGEGGAA